MIQLCVRVSTSIEFYSAVISKHLQKSNAYILVHVKFLQTISCKQIFAKLIASHYVYLQILLTILMDLKVLGVYY